MVARCGLLKSRRHTSNFLSYLVKMVPEYSEGANYVDTLATKDQSIITASGLGSIEFTIEIFKELALANEKILPTGMMYLSMENILEALKRQL